jgi:hypothetical protein
MAERAGTPYRSANAGELSQEIAGRIDIKQFYSAGLRYKNIEPKPVSGFHAMAGSVDTGLVRKRVAPLAKSAETLTGTDITGTATLWQATVAGTVCAIDCTALLSSAGTQQVQAQALVGASWVNVGAAIPVLTTARAITMALPPGAGVAATAVRLQATTTVAALLTVGTVTVLAEGTESDAPRYTSVKHDSGYNYFMSLQRQFMDIYEDDAFVAGIYLPELGSALSHVCFYAENATIGIADRTVPTQRVRRSGSSQEWVRDAWPFDGIPGVDLGGTYTKHDDVWEINIKWSGHPEVVLAVTVDGEVTTGVDFVDSLGASVAIDGAVDKAATAAAIKVALEALPSLGPGITVSVSDVRAKTSRMVTITFGGALTGQEYQVNAEATNTGEAGALASHIEIGKTDYEPLMSVARGWCGVFGFAQDRTIYGDFKAVPPAIAFSKAGEYFDLNIEAAGDRAARMDKLRDQVSERVLAFTEATYLLIGTDRGVYFVSNRAVTAGEPLNFVHAAEAGVVPACDFVKLENKVYYIGATPEGAAGGAAPTGHQVLSLSYSEIDTNFDANPEHIMAAHLVQGIIRAKGQRSQLQSEASKMWMLRDDGRLAVACVIKSQDVLGFCEWVLAASGLAKEIHVDAANAVRVAVQRSGVLRHERLDRDQLFQSARVTTCDLSGGITGFNHLEGQAVWAEAEGWVLGPFTVTGGSISLGDAYTGPVTVGLWQAPVWESMPRFFVNKNDEIVKRPGRIHSCVAEVIDTTSLAIGANGEAAENVPLTRTSDAVDAAPAPHTGRAERIGMLGFKEGTTLVVTQTRPGRLHVRDLTIKEKL